MKHNKFRRRSHSVLKSAFLGALAQRYVAGHRDQEFLYAFRLRVLGVKIQTHKMA